MIQTGRGTAFGFMVGLLFHTSKCSQITNRFREYSFKPLLFTSPPARPACDFEQPFFEYISKGYDADDSFWSLSPSGTGDRKPVTSEGAKEIEFP